MGTHSRARRHRTPGWGMTVSEPDLGGYPHCDAPGATRVTCASLRAQVWTCRACGGRWRSSNRYSQSFLDRVANEVRVRSALREVIALTERASVLTLTDPQVRARLIALAGTARSACHECRSTDEAPAVHWPRLTPSGQPDTRRSCLGTAR